MKFEYVHISLIRALLLKDINVVKNGHGIAFISDGWKARRRRAIAATCFYISDKKRYMALKLSFKKKPRDISNYIGYYIEIHKN